MLFGQAFTPEIPDFRYHLSEFCDTIIKLNETNQKKGFFMAFDGIVVANLVHELKEQLLNGRIAKIAQPEADELLLTIKSPKGQRRLSISASASLPLIYLTDANKPSPMTAPNFCMLLRKHIANGRIVDIWQPKLERIIHFTIEHLDELGDLCRKDLIVEIMGKHSNIIFCTSDGTIIDSIKHVSAQMSSVREVLPGRDYFIPDTMEKQIRSQFQKPSSIPCFVQSQCRYPRQSTPALPGSVPSLLRRSVFFPV